MSFPNSDFRIFFEHNPVAMWVYDPETRELLEVNRAAASLFERATPSWRSLSLDELRPVHGFSTSESMLQLEYRPVVLVVAQPDPVQGANDTNQIIFDSVPAMIWFKDDQNNILKINKVAAEAIGASGERMRGRKTADFYADEADKYYSDDLEVIRTGAPKRGIIEMVAMASGEKHWCQTDKLPYRDASGRVVGVIVFSQDIHERRLAEEKLNQLAKELERSNRDLEEFAAIVSHDLREPLRMVISYLKLVSSQFVSSPYARNSKLREFLSFASEGAIRMRELIEALLAYSRIGSSSFKFERADCNVILEGVLKDLSLSIDESGARVDHTELPVLAGHPAQIAQLFQNLISNAIKFRGGLPPRISIWADRAGNEWVFGIRDNGIGIPMDQAERIFLFFQRLHDAQSYPGTGVGLASCKRIVERHGGRMWVKSRLGQGSTFYFTFSAEPGSAHSPLGAGAPRHEAICHTAADSTDRHR